MQPGPKISAKGQQEPAVALRLGPTAPSATAMHELVRPRISTFAGGSRTPRPTDASTRAYAIPNSGKTAVHSWGRSPARQARRIKLLQHSKGGLRVIYFESPGYTKRRVANPYREGVLLTPCDPRPTTHLHRAALHFSRSCANTKQALGRPTSHGNPSVAAGRVLVSPHTGCQGC